MQEHSIFIISTYKLLVWIAKSTIILGQALLAAIDLKSLSIGEKSCGHAANVKVPRPYT